MHTLITDSPPAAAAVIRAGKLAAFPTETVYGLGADALDDGAIRKIYEVKGRPLDNPLIVHLATAAEIYSVGHIDHDFVHDLVEAFIPGPLTLVLRKTSLVSRAVTAGLDTVAVRVPDHAVARAFLNSCDRPVAAPSANKSGRPSPTTWEAVRQDFEGQIECILRGRRSPIGLESTVVDCTSKEPVVLREGAITFGQLREVVSVASGDLRDSPGGPVAGITQPPRSPGLRHRHYAPSAQVFLVDNLEVMPETRASFIGLTEPRNVTSFALARVCGDVDQYGYELYQFFRDSDALSVETIYCERPPNAGLGSTIIDRIRRASKR